MKNRKGFTLIELLAVIVILAIIALIAVPVIMGMIASSRETAAVDSAKLIVREAQLAYQETFMLCDGHNPTIPYVMTKIKMDGIEHAAIDLENHTIKDGFGNTCTITPNAHVTCVNDKYSDVAKIQSTSKFVEGECDLRESN